MNQLKIDAVKIGNKSDMPNIYRIIFRFFPVRFLPGICFNGLKTTCVYKNRPFHHEEAGFSS